MTEETLVGLWRLQTEMMMLERTFWLAAANAVSDGLASYDDVGVIYGCHPSTARKRANEAVDIHARQVIQESWDRGKRP